MSSLCHSQRDWRSKRKFMESLHRFRHLHLIHNIVMAPIYYNDYFFSGKWHSFDKIINYNFPNMWFERFFDCFFMYRMIEIFKQFLFVFKRQIYCNVKTAIHNFSFTVNHSARPYVDYTWYSRKPPGNFNYFLTRFFITGFI